MSNGPCRRVVGSRRRAPDRQTSKRALADDAAAPARISACVVPRVVYGSARGLPVAVEPRHPVHAPCYASACQASMTTSLRRPSACALRALGSSRGAPGGRRGTLRGVMRLGSRIRRRRCADCGTIAPLGRHGCRDRFWRQVDRTPTCWLWIGAVNPNGYGSFSWHGRQQGAHRVAYRMEVGEIHAGLTIDHLCRVRACVNPAHLEPVTSWENTSRGQSISAVNARKTHCSRGHRLGSRRFSRGPGRSPVRQCLVCVRIVRAARARLWAESGGAKSLCE